MSVDLVASGGSSLTSQHSASSVGGQGGDSGASHLSIVGMWEAGQLAPFSTLASLASFLGKGTDTLLLRRRPSDTHGAVESERRHSWTRRRDDSRAEERPDRTGTLLHRLRSTALNLPAPHPVLARSCFNSAPMHRYSFRRRRLRVAQTHPRSRRPPPGARRQPRRTRPICFRHSTPGARSCCRPPSQRTRSRTADGSNPCHHP